MKSAYLLTAALCLTTLSDAGADEPGKKKSGRNNPAGTWVWESDVGGEFIESQLTLLMRGKKVTGEYSDQNVSLEIEDGAFDGKTVTFTLEFDVDGTEIKASFSGVAEADKLAGTTKLSINGEETEMAVDAKRQTGRADVVGKWKLNVATGNGEVFAPTVTLSLQKGKLAGTYEDEAAGKHDLQDVSLRNNQLSFSISGNAADGSTFSATFTGTPRGNRIRGKSDVVINDSETTAKVRGRKLHKNNGAGGKRKDKTKKEQPEG